MRVASTEGSTSELPRARTSVPPRAGVVAFAGRLPRQGLCLTVRTEDGWSVTLVHLGSIRRARRDSGQRGRRRRARSARAVSPRGRSRTSHLGIRLTADPNGYVDPLTLLPPRQAPEQVPPVQQTSQVQAPAPPVAARHAGPSRSAPRRRHAAAAKARVPQRSAATPRARQRMRLRGAMSTPRFHSAPGSPCLGARRRRARAVRARSSRARPSAAHRTRAPEPNGTSAGVRRRTASRRHLRRRSWKRGRVARGGCC